MLKLFRRKAHVDKKRRERALAHEQTLAAQDALKKRVDRLVAGKRKADTPQKGR